MFTCHLRKDRQGEHFRRCFFTVGEVALAITQRAEAGLQVNGYWIVNLTAHALRSQVVHELVASLYSNDVLVENVAMTRDFRHLNLLFVEPRLRKQTVVFFSVSSSSFRPRVEMSEFAAKNCCL